ncbi:MAG: hypothetical protein JW709_04360, partial [Sedimentisphaerales bacterium]|nr:hypothetical protein [Sedimentisphaerales bacterium]
TIQAQWESNEMWQICVNRHRKKINLVFKDTHVDQVDLPDLWLLRSNNFEAFIYSGIDRMPLDY